MRITVLASGSRGNATLVEAGGSRVLVDAGVTGRTLQRRYEAAHGAAMGPLSGVVITHGHGDHAAHATTIAGAHDASVWVTEPAKRAAFFRHARGLRVYGRSSSFRVGAFLVHPFPVPHDAPQVALVIEHGGLRAAIVTDLGTVPRGLARHLAGCGTILLESNHDPAMLESGPYPRQLKDRIASGQGHLSNAQAATFVQGLEPSVASIVLMHLSATNNRPELALSATREALGSRRTRLRVASQNVPLVEEVSAAPSQLALLI